jgi:hypothetical protein
MYCRREWGRNEQGVDSRCVIYPESPILRHESSQLCNSELGPRVGVPTRQDPGILYGIVHVRD